MIFLCRANSRHSENSEIDLYEFAPADSLAKSRPFVDLTPSATDQPHDLSFFIALSVGIQRVLVNGLEQSIQRYGTTVYVSNSK